VESILAYMGVGEERFSNFSETVLIDFPLKIKIRRSLAH